MIKTSNKDFCNAYLKYIIGENTNQDVEFSDADELAEENTTTIDENTDIEQPAEEKPKDCPYCHGTGYRKSYSDEPDPVCPDCNGSGIEESAEPSEEEGEQETEIEATISTEEDEEITEEDDEYEGSSSEEGWGNEILDILEPAFDKAESIYYELKNGYKGDFTSCYTREELKEYLKEFITQVVDAVDEL